MKTQPMTKYESLSYLLGQYGTGEMDAATFWKEMNGRGYTQTDIDLWCDEYYKLEAQKELDNARRKEEQDRTKGARFARPASTASREGQANDRQDVQASQDRDAQGRQGQGGGAVQANGEARKGSLTLSQQWIDRAVDVGKQRFDFAKGKGYVNYGINPEGDVKYNIMGCLAECIISARYKVRWRESVGSIDGIDVGKIIEVRGRPLDYELGIRPKDKRWLPHVLVWVYPDYSMDIQGWLYGYEGVHEVEEGAEPDWRWNANSKCWYNPPPYRPIEELDEIVADDEAVERILQRHLEWTKEQERKKRERNNRR